MSQTFQQFGEISAQEPPALTMADSQENLARVPVNQQTCHFSQSLPSYLLDHWWSWIEKHEGDANNNIITNQALAPYYCKKYLWNDQQSYAVVAKLDNEDYTVILHDKKVRPQAIMNNYIILPMGAV